MEKKIIALASMAVVAAVAIVAVGAPAQSFNNTHTQLPGPMSGAVSVDNGGNRVSSAHASGDVVTVSKAFYYNSTGGYVELLVKASSTDPQARLSVYASTGEYIGAVQNNGAVKYGGTVLTWHNNPASITIRSSSGGSKSVDLLPLEPNKT